MRSESSHHNIFPQQIVEEILSVAHVQAVAARSGVSISNFDKDFGVDDFGNPIVLTLPRNDSFGDALRRLSEAVNLVAFLENRSPESLLVDLHDRSAHRLA